MYVLLKLLKINLIKFLQEKKNQKFDHSTESVFTILQKNANNIAIKRSYKLCVTYNNDARLSKSMSKISTSKLLIFKLLIFKVIDYTLIKIVSSLKEIKS